MKLTISRAILASSFAGAFRVVERHNTIPILGNVLLTAQDGTLRLKATDLDMETTITVAAQVAEPGAITAPAGILNDICRRLPDVEDVRLELQGETLVLAAGRSRFRLQTLPASDFPDIAPGEFPHRFEMTGRDLGRLIAKSKFAISTEETRYYLNGIFMHVVEGDDGPMLTAVATDRHRLARIRTLAPEGAQGMPGIIVPRKSVEEIARLAELADKSALALEVSDAKIRVSLESAGATFVSKLIDGTFPDYTRVIPAGGSRRVVVDTAQFALALTRVGAVPPPTRGGGVKLELDETRMTIAVNNPDIGQADEEIEIAMEGAPMIIGLNRSYAEMILGVLGVDRVAIALSDPGSPTLWEEAREDGADEQPNALYVLMPMWV